MTESNTPKNTPTPITTNSRKKAVAATGIVALGASITAGAAYVGARLGAAAALASTVVKVAVPEGFELVKTIIK
jgi:hypothetical protein